MKSHAVLVLVLGVVLTSWPRWPAWAGPQTQSPSSLDKLQLDDLTPRPMEKLDQQLFSPDQPAPSPEQAPNGPTTPGALNEQLQRELGRAAQSEADSPLVDIARAMLQVEQRIGKADSGQETQEMQGRILTNLDELLRQARAQCQACQGACNKPGGQQKVAQREKVQQPKDIPPAPYVKRKNSGGGADPSRAKAGPDRVSPGMKVIKQPNMEEMRALLKDLWGELPERERQQMLQMPVEEFLPKYELLIEQYFKRLAEPEEEKK